jgi:hypothetical protein
MCVEHNTHGRSTFQSRQTTAEFRVVCYRGTDANQNRIVFRTQQMRKAPRVFARNPAVRAGWRNGLAIAALRQLQCHERPIVFEAPKKTSIRLRCFMLKDSHTDVNAGRTQHGKALAPHARIGILDRRNQAYHTGSDQRLCAGWRLRQMGAGLERHVRGTTA